MSDDEPEFWVEYETGNEHYRCSICGNVGPVPQTTEEFTRRRDEHLAAAHNDGWVGPHLCCVLTEDNGSFCGKELPCPDHSDGSNDG